MGDAPALISLRGLSKRYGEGELAVQVLHDIDLDIQAGEFVAIMGASGSGKSTLMHLLGCLDQPSDGRYCFAGRDVAAMASDELARLRRESFGFIFQSYHLIGACNALENVEIPAIYAGLDPASRHQRAEALLTRLGLADRLQHRPAQLSGGQQQRVSIARALMNGGQVLLADEPTGALDSHSGDEVMSLLNELAEQGHTVILITHDPKVAAHAHRQIELLDGRVVKDTGSQRPASVPVQIAPANTEHGRFNEMQEAGRMAIRSLRANVFRTLLTLLGIVIGVASVVAMLAIGEGAKQSVLDRINAMGSNLLMVYPQRHGRTGAADAASLELADARALAQMPNVLSAVPENQGNVTARYGNIDVNTEVTATTAEYPNTRNWPVIWGTFFTPEDELSHAAVAVLGKTVVTAMFPGQDPLGHYVLLNKVPFQIIGIMDEKGATGWGRDADDVIFVPLSTGNLRLFGQTNLRSITVSVDQVEAMPATQIAMEALLDQRHSSNDFRVRNMADIVDAVSETQNTLTVLLGSIAAISLLVGGIGVMNIMLVSVTERVHEIGIRMATGARTRNILQQFLTEAVVVSALGGVLGVALGVTVGLISAALSMPAVFSATTMLLAFASAAGTGLIFGFSPALKAARLNPVVALASD